MHFLVCPRKSCEAFGELIEIDFVGGCSCGLGAGEVTCAVDKCKELSMLGMRRSRGGLNLMDKILAVWEAFGIWQAPESVVNSLPCKSYKKQTAQCSDDMEQ
uniref:Uncharacterized protein n=1 Tax=Oryza glumipatula TaxID=40148 RepID=A0A0D9YTF2_9ORYZ